MVAEILELDAPRVTEREPSSRVAAPARVLLAARGIEKHFSGITALAGVDFELRAGEVHALCGENGAGKSTLIKILTGIHPAGSFTGEIAVDGQLESFGSVRDAEKAGIAVIYQELALVDEMSVAENVFLGHEPRRGGLIDEQRMIEETRDVLGRFGIELHPETPVKNLGVGQKQLVEIAKALRKESRILILDEPSAALSDREVEVLLGIVLELKRRGVGLVYISHKLDEVFRIADRITVLRDGSTIVTDDASAFSPERVIEHMVGRKLDTRVPRRRPELGQCVLEVSGLRVAERAGGPVRLDGISFELRRGEVLGIGGLMGAGRSELCSHLFGVWGKRVAGSVKLNGKDLATTPHACIRQGLVLVSEDRKRLGLSLEESVGFNLSLSSLTGGSLWRLVDGSHEAHENAELVRHLNLKAPSLEAPVRTLSGGNQQKVVLGKALRTRPSVLLLDEPTRGIDVGAKFEIYELINRLTAEGIAVVLVSSEMPELIGMSDRILMLAEGTIGGQFEGQAEGQRVSQAALLAAAMKRSRTEKLQ
jgi:D-xylose transport system ATP-binding protein